MDLDEAMHGSPNGASRIGFLPHATYEIAEISRISDLQFHVSRVILSLFIGAALRRLRNERTTASFLFPDTESTLCLRRKAWKAFEIAYFKTRRKACFLFLL
ncbi:MAG: hypothetical protein LIO58_07635 [Oscillospiraceae bacterium]|nr:hypothetical protein [Oscillospiraceae bacterium]